MDQASVAPACHRPDDRPSGLRPAFREAFQEPAHMAVFGLRRQSPIAEALAAHDQGVQWTDPGDPCSSQRLLVHRDFFASSGMEPPAIRHPRFTARSMKLPNVSLCSAAEPGPGHRPWSAKPITHPVLARPRHGFPAGTRAAHGRFAQKARVRSSCRPPSEAIGPAMTRTRRPVLQVHARSPALSRTWRGFPSRITCGVGTVPLSGSGAFPVALACCATLRSPRSLSLPATARASAS